MKKQLFFTILIFFVSISSLLAQAPQQFNYQGAARNPNGSPIANKAVSIRISILDGSANGTSQYSETRNIITNSLGLYSIQIGSKDAVSTTGDFSAVNWGFGQKYIKVEVDPNNGSNFSVAGTAQLLSVPYALYAASGGGGTPGISAYQIALKNGFVGTEAQWLTSLQGAVGPAGAVGPQGPAGTYGTDGAVGPA